MFQVINDANTIMIDSTYYNHGITMAGQGTTANPGGIVRAYVLDIAYQSNNPSGEVPLIGFKCAVPVALLWMRKSGSTYNIRLITATAAVITYMIFDRPTGGGNSGMQIFDATSRLTFDSNFRYLKVLNVLRRTSNDNTPIAVADSAASCVVVTCPQIGMQMDVLPAVPGGVWRLQSYITCKAFLLIENQLRMNNIIYSIDIVPGNTGPPPSPIPNNGTPRYDVIVASSVGY